MNSRWTLLALLFSVAVNIAVVSTLFFFWQQNGERRMDIQVLHNDPHVEHDVVWFEAPHVPPKIADEIDSLRRHYHERLVVIRSAIHTDRQTIINQLLKEPVNRDSINVIVETLTNKQIDAERLTINHLLDIKPLLSREDWTFFIQDLEPRHTIHTKIIQITKGDSTILIDKNEIREIQIFQHNKEDKDRIIKYKQKN